MPQMDQIFSGTKAFQAPILARSLGQLATSFGGFFATCTAMYLCLAVSLWITLPMSALAAGFLVRIFIIQHDCGHGSFFRSRWANELIGRLCSLMTLTPYAFWRRQHARHHGSWNNLDRRAASGLDIYSSCMTVAEYRAARTMAQMPGPPHQSSDRRQPVAAALGVCHPLSGAVRRGQGMAARAPRGLPDQPCLGRFFRRLGFALGYGRVAAVQLPIMVIASIVGVWLFSIQHRFEHAQWIRTQAGVCRSLARRHFPPSPAAPPPVVYRQYRLSSRAPSEPSDPELSARGMPQRRCRVSSGVNSYAAYRASGLGLRIVGQRSGAPGAVSLRRLAG